MYQELEIEILKFNVDDVLADSNTNENPWVDDNVDSDGWI